MEKLVKYNKGEWCEIYVFLKGLVDGKFQLMDKYENSLDSYHLVYEIFKKTYNNTKEIGFKPREKDKDLYIFAMNNLFSKIIESNETTFNIPSMEKFAFEQDFSLSKGNSYEKGDLKASIKFDKIFYPEVLYSVKSKINSSATLLNASTATNFEYQVTNLKNEDIKCINNINTKTKLRDRIYKIKELGGKIKFLDVANETFSCNLDYIDGHLKLILSEILLISYYSHSKKISDLVGILECNNILNANLVQYPRFYKDKIIKFLLEITFNMMPSTPMNSSSNMVFGGILYVYKNGEVFLVDNLSYKHLGEYLFDNLKLDTPSSTRYNMLNIKDDKFTLSLQIRFI